MRNKKTLDIDHLKKDLIGNEWIIFPARYKSDGWNVLVRKHLGPNVKFC